MPVFHHLLANNLIANITNFTVWFAVTFWVFLETRSVFATGRIAGLYLVLTASLAIWFGSLVDHNRKKRVMLASSLVSLALYAAALGAGARGARLEGEVDGADVLELRDPLEVHLRGVLTGSQGNGLGASGFGATGAGVSAAIPPGGVKALGRGASQPLEPLNPGDPWVLNPQGRPPRRSRRRSPTAASARPSTRSRS